MKSSYKRLGDFIEFYNIRAIELDKNLDIESIRGISSISKSFIKTKANLVGVVADKYKVVTKNCFAYNPNTARMGDKIPIALNTTNEIVLVSSIYPTFKIIKTNELDPEYLMMWFKRYEFDRYARYKSHGSAREVFDIEEMNELVLPIPSIEKQQEIVREYNTIHYRILLNKQLITKLEETVQAIYRQWFLENNNDFEKTSLDQYIEFNPKHSISKGKIVSYIEMSDLQENSMCIKGLVQREFSAGSKFKNDDVLLARITPCLENGKTGFVNVLIDNEVAFGSTEFIVMRAKEKISPYWLYCLAKDENFRLHAISSMVGSSGRQRVHEKYLNEFQLPVINFDIMKKFNFTSKPIFETIKLKSIQNRKLEKLKELLFAKMTRAEN